MVNFGSIVGAIGIGRGATFCPESERFSNHMTVSCIRARVFYADGKWFVRDMDSTNDTHLNGIQVNVNENMLIRDMGQLFSR